MLVLVTLWAAQLPAPAQANPLSFNVGPRYQLGLNALDRSFADFDSDGFIDIVAVNGGQGNPNPTVTVLFGDGSGGFGDTIILPTFAIGHAVATGDLNDDGRPDIVVASFYHNALGVIHNQGERQFAQTVITIPPNPGSEFIGEYFSVGIADFDGDGHNDVVGLEDQSNQRLRFFHANNDGTLSIFATLEQNSGGTSYEAKMAIGDINGDSFPDVVLAGGGPFGARGFRFVFGQPAGTPLAFTYGFAVADKAVGIEIVDLDGDNGNDLVVAFKDTTTPTRHSLQVFGNDGGAVFSPQPKMFLEYPFPPDDITVGDYNADGRLDIAALLGSVYYPGLMVLVKYGSSGLEFEGETYYASSSSTSIYSIDVDLNGTIDIITASSFGLQTDYDAYSGVSTSTLSVMANRENRDFVAPLAITWGPNFIDYGDFNRDGYVDLASAWMTNVFTTSGVDLMMNDHAGSFVLPELRQPSPVAMNDMRTGDFNGDGKRDAVSSHDGNAFRGIALYIGDGVGGLNTALEIPFTDGLREISVGDFDGNGCDDVFVLDRLSKGHVLLGNTLGTLTHAPESPIVFTGVEPVSVRVGDFNRDSALDLIISRNAQLYLWLGDGSGRFSSSPASIPSLKNPFPGDFNGDGNLDLAGMAPPTGPLPPWRTDEYLTAVLGDGKGGFNVGFQVGIRNFSHSTVQSLVTGDLDLDGFDDVALIMRENTFGNLVVVTSASGTTWREPKFFGVGPATETLIAHDFDRDGDTDLAFRGDNGRGVVYNTRLNPRTLVPFDFDGDGRTDVSIFRPSVGEWWYLRSSDGGNFAAQFGAETDVIVPGDYTGDGKADFAFFRPSTGEWFVLRSEDFSFYAFPFGTGTDIPAPADYDGDGKTDPAVFRPSTGTWFIVRSSDGQVTITSFGTAGDQPVAGDYDGDGSADIAIFRPNGTSGAEWWIQRSTDGLIAAQFGQPTDKAAAGDYTGDGKTDMALFRPSTGEWFVLRSEDFSFYAFPFGTTGDLPAPGDYDGDGTTDAAVFRPSSATWFMQGSTSGTVITPFGQTGDRAVPNAYVR